MELTSLNWKWIEGLQPERRQRILQWQLQAREPIRSFKDIKIGDHLVIKRSFLNGLIPYEHHFLCIGNDEGKPKISHYYNTAWHALKQLFPDSLGCGSAIEQLGIVQEMTLPHEDFIKSETELQAEGNGVERIVWPEELRRYSAEEVVERAEKRKGEKWYDLAKNNCETFVMWCLCDLQISFQVTTAVRKALEVGGATIKALRQALQQVPKVLVEQFGDDLFLAVIKANSFQAALPEEIGVYVGAALSIFVEVCLAYNEIKSACQKWKKGIIIETREKFIKAVIDSVLSASLRAAGSIVGIMFGQTVIPIPVLGTIIGPVLCALAGDIVSKRLTDFGVTECLAQKIDYICLKINRLINWIIGAI